ncbi:MAG: alpha/beta hydrolase [Chloroflexi bacterium]|nr:alpha/beta hydrolase [Chloroflexota bacterium]
MPVDPQVQEFLDQIAALGLPPHYEVGAVKARENAKMRPRGAGPEVGAVENLTVPGMDVDVPVRVYWPGDDGPFPILVWIHGGGMVVGTLETCDAACRRLCLGAECVVVSVDYRLAPEDPFPAAAEDSYAAVKWASANAGSIKGDASRLAVGGESAGGNLAAAVALMARDRGGPSIVHQSIINPMLGLDFDTESYLRNAEGYFLTRRTMMWYWEQYLQRPEDRENPYAVLMCAEDLSGLPPALLMAGEYDPLLSETEAYAERLQAAGVAATFSYYAGASHNFYNMPPSVDIAVRAMGEIIEAVRAAFGSGVKA